jgi:ATP-dependent DNA helicase DinG
MDTNQVTGLLDSLAQFLSNYKPRPGQQKMASAVAEAIEERANLVVEGGTGIGKSMAYLVPAALAVVQDGKRVLIATSHKPLQDQIARKDLPKVAELFRAKGYRSFTFTTLKGISNYLCWNSAEGMRERLVPDPGAIQAINYALFAGPDFSGDFEEFPFNLPPDSRALVSADSDDCLGTRCPHRDRCFALKARQQAEQADVVVTNHALLSLDIRSEGYVIPGTYASYIIDEGHNFEENVTRANGLTATIGGIRRFLNHELVRGAAVTNTHRLSEARENLEKLQDEIASFFTVRSGDAEDENRIIVKREISSGKVMVESLKDLLALVKSKIALTEEEQARYQRVIKQGGGLAERLEKISANADPNLVYFVERNYYGLSRDSGEGRDPIIKVNGRTLSQLTPSYSMNAMPIDISGYLTKWFRENQVIVTSATMSDGQNFDFFTRRVGLEKPATLIVPSPFNYRERVRLFLPRLGAPAPGANYSQHLASRLVTLLNATPGRALFLFTSHAMMEGVWRQLNGPLAGSLQPARPLFKQGNAQMQRIIADFQASPNGLILGTRSWWQGVDLPGMRLLVMDKLPFPQLNDPLIKARIEEIDKEGGSSFTEFMLPLAIITFRQGFGRLMRQESDRGVVVVCDERVVQKNYGRRFIKSLPELELIGNLDQYREFLSGQQALNL